MDKTISTLSRQIQSQLQTVNCSVGDPFVIKSTLNSIFFNSFSVRLKAAVINRHKSRPAAVGKPRKSVGGDTDDSDRLTL